MHCFFFIKTHLITDWLHCYSIDIQLYNMYLGIKALININNCFLFPAPNSFRASWMRCGQRPVANASFESVQRRQARKWSWKWKPSNANRQAKITPWLPSNSHKKSPGNRCFCLAWWSSVLILQQATCWLFLYILFHLVSFQACWQHNS